MSSMANKVNEVFKSSADLIKNLSADDLIKEQVINTSNVIINAIRNNNKVIFFGNGGSAADSQHMAGEFVCRFMFDRKSLPGIALTTDSSVLTAISNDYGYENWVARALEFYADIGDLVILISSSGKSPNMVNGAHQAKKMGLTLITLTGFSSDNSLRKLGDLNLWVCSNKYNIVEMTHQVWLLAIIDFFLK